jgi:hypothetical protein
MKPTEIKRLQLAAKHSAYNADTKREFRRLALKALRELNELLGINADVRYNAGGIAVSGEATLHGDGLYVQIQQSCVMGFCILVRTCKGRKDYTGGRNTYFPVERLNVYGIQGLGAYCAQLVAFEESRVSK